MRKDNANQHISGISMEPPRLLTKAPSGTEEFLFNAILVLLCLSGVIWSVISAFSLPVQPLNIHLFLYFITALFLASAQLKRAGYLILVTIALIYFYLLFYMRYTLLQGFLISIDQIFSAWSAHSGFTFPIYMISAKTTQYAAFCTSFLLTVLLPFTGLICFAIYKKSIILTFILTFPPLLSALAFGITPSVPAVLALAAAWTALIFIRPANRKKRFSKKRIKLRAEGTASKMGLLMLIVVTACFTLICLLLPAKQYKPPAQAETFRSGIIGQLSNVDTLLQMGSSINGLSSQVNLRNIGSLHFYGKTMLRVWTSGSNPVYLKGFTGSVYTGNSWQQLADDQYKSAESKLYGMNVQNMLHSYLSMFPGKSGAVNQFEIRVNNIAAGLRHIYAPYHLATTPKDINGVSFVHDAFICSGYLIGTAKYNLFAYNPSDISSDSSPESVFLSALTDIPFSNRKSNFALTDPLRSYLLRQNRFYPLNDSDIQDYYKSTLPDGLLDTLSSDKRNFVKAEQEYRLFMYDPYTALPQGIRDKVRSLLKREGLIRNYQSVDEMVSAVQKFLRKGYTYTLSPGSVPDGHDFTEYFLFEHKKGYCVHFATAATVMLRAMGVPARYADGYIVTSGDYKNAAGGWADVKDNRAHAWVEIYRPGLGWQPVEVTSGFRALGSGIGDHNPTDLAGTSVNPASSAPTAPKNTPGVSVSPAANRKSVFSGLHGIVAVLFFVSIPLALCFALLCFLILRRKVVLVRRERLFSSQNYNMALLAIYGYCLKLERYGGKIDAKITELAEKARFSRHRISGEELKLCKDYANIFARQNYDLLNMRNRLKFKYVDDLI